YRLFETANRRFIVADTPGHEQYTRNMVTGASRAELAVLVVDARRGLLQQTRRHANIAALMGISRIVLAVSKMDLVDYDASKFKSITDEFKRWASALNFSNIESIPVSGLLGDNVRHLSKSTPWFDGPTLFDALEMADTCSQIDTTFRMPIQYVIRVATDLRGYAGLPLGAGVAVGDEVMVYPSRLRSRVR